MMFTKISIILLVCSTVVCGQNKTATISDVTGLLDIINLHENGFIVKSASGNVCYFDAEGSVVWQKNIPSTKGWLLNSYNTVVISPSDSTFYHVEINKVGQGFNKKEHHITVISKEGKETKFNIQGSPNFGKNLQSIFADDKYLYYLATTNGDELEVKSRSFEKLILTRFDRHRFSPETFTLDLPDLKPGENVSFWSFVGSHEDIHYVVSKELDIDNRHAIFTIVGFDSDGKIGNPVKVHNKLSTNHLRPSYNLVSVSNEVLFYESPRRRFTNVVNVDFAPYSRENLNEYGHSPVGQGGFSHLYYDEQSNDFFVFGLLGEKPFTKVASVYNGYYVKRFKADGNLLWTVEDTAPAELLSNSYFKIHASPGSRQTDLNILGDETINLNFKLPGNRQKISIGLSPTGDKLGYIADADEFVEKGRANESIQFLANRKSAKHRNEFYNLIALPKVSIVLVYDVKKHILDVYSFMSNGPWPVD